MQHGVDATRCRSSIRNLPKRRLQQHPPGPLQDITNLLLDLIRRPTQLPLHHHQLPTLHLHANLYQQEMPSLDSRSSKPRMN